jgi:hypothetical protein
MRVALLSPPGRLPTVVYDPGAWWSDVVALGMEPRRLDLNAAWWKAICGASGANAARAGSRTVVQRLFHRDMPASAAAAGRSLQLLSERDTYATADGFIGSVTPFARHLSALNHAQSDVFFHIDFGVRVIGLDYDDSRALVAYARRETPLSVLIEAALDPIDQPVDIVVVTVSRPEELLSALIAVRLLKRRHPGVHACLADHSHENFTLATHLDRLRASGSLDAVFDTIIERRDDRDMLVPSIVAKVAAGQAPSGYLSRPAQPEPARVHGPAVVPPSETFCSEPILWTRLSPRRCYWDRCTFCALNAKFSDPRSPSVDSVPDGLDRLEAAASLGYHTINFGDEALSPAILERLSRGILDRGIEVRWACCCKLETAYTPALFRLMRAAGCYEVFWGLETISPRVLRLMQKEVPGLDRAGIGRILREANRAGLGLHVSLMAGFPGDTPGDAVDTVEFVVETLRDLSNATFNLNRFMLLDGSPIMAEPEPFGVIPKPATGDMPFRRAYQLVGGIADDADRIDRAFPWLLGRLREGLGWDRFGSGRGVQTALDLHFYFGQGSIFKQRAGHAFANPLRNVVATA